MIVNPQISELDQTGISERHKLGIADCIIAWARFESQLRALLARLEGKALDEGALQYSRLAPDDAWRKIKRTLKERGASEAVLERVQFNREASRDSYHFRRTIVHAGCVGVWSKDADYLCFAPYEAESQGNMVVEWLPLGGIKEATAIAEGGFRLAMRILEMIGD